MLLDKVRYNAKKYVKINRTENKLYLYDEAELYYQDIELRAGIIILDYSKNEVYAGRIPNDKDSLIQFPYFKQANNEVNPDSIRFNFDTQKALIWNSKSGENGMDVFSALTKKQNDSVYYIKDARVSTAGKVLGGIEAAQVAGLRVKINTVALKGFNEDELFRLVSWCNERGMDLTWIEVMPMGDLESEQRIGQYWSLNELRQTLAQEYTLTDMAERTGGPARYVKINETGQKIGFITPMSHNFCESCNRVRLTCTGELYMCLGQEDKADLRRPIREKPNDEDHLRIAIQSAIAKKPRGHDFDYTRQQVHGQMTRMAIVPYTICKGFSGLLKKNI